MDRRYSKAVRSTREEGHEYVSTAFESLDYDRHGSEAAVREEEAKGNVFLATIVAQRVILFLLTGMVTGIVGALLDIGVHYGTIARFTLLQYYVGTHYPHRQDIMYIIWMASVCFPALLGCLLVIYGDLRASGGGIHWCLAHLNGVNMDSYMSMRILVVKMFSCMLCVISGLPGGKEAPMVHIGSIIGNSIPMVGFRKIQPFDFFYQEPERRDLAAGGAAAGLTAAFSAPLAGIMLSFEESISFWNVDLTFLIFICTISSYFMLQFSIGLFVKKCPRCFAEKSEFMLDILKETIDRFYLAEIIIYILLGVLGGLLGALWNYFQKNLIIIRKRFVNTKVRKVAEIMSFSVIFGLVQASLLVYLRDSCVPKDPKIVFYEEHSYHVQLDCVKSKLPTVSLFFLQHPVQILRSMFTGDKSTMLGVKPLMWFGIYYFVGCNLLCGCAISHGIFIPHVLTGAVWGRLLAEALILWVPGSESWVNPNQFAFLLGAAQLSGSQHITYTISMMMLEACNSTRLAMPLFIVACIAKIVSSFFCESIYHTQSGMSGLPMLEKVGPPVTSKIITREAMARPVLTLPTRPTFKNIATLLTSCNHNGFPVVDSQRAAINQDGVRTYGTLKGLIQRSQLTVILHYGLTEEDLVYTRNLRLLRRGIIALDLTDTRFTANENLEVNLEPFMNNSPYIISINAPLSLAYRLFSNLGIRHLVAVDSNLQVAGLITRKDLSIYRFYSKFCIGENVILPLR